MNKNKLKRKLKQNIPCVGIFLALGDPLIVEIAGIAGLDWVIVDMEHFNATREKLQEMVRAANLVDISLLVRIPFNKDDILRVIDAGVGGVVVPHIMNAYQVQEIVKWTKYSPEGMRGFSQLHRAGLFGSISINEYIREANEEMLIGIMVEDKEGIENINKIIKVKNLDLIFIGPNDLSQSITGNINPGHPKVIAEIKKLVEICKQNKGPSCGVLCGKYTNLHEWINTGATFFSVGNDEGIFLNAIKTEVESFKKIMLDKKQE